MSGFCSTSDVRFGCWCWPVGGVGEWRSSTPSRGLAAERSYAAVRADLIDQASVRVRVGEPPRPVEDREAAIRIVVNAHGRLDEVAAMALLGNLQDTALIADRVVVAHHALLLDAQDVVEHAHKGHEGRPLLGGRDRETGV